MKQKQRYKCKACGCNYTQSTTYRIALSTRIEAIKLYLEGVGFRGISRLTGVHHTTVIQWVKHLGSEIERLAPEVEEASLDVELDEMWHFIQNSRVRHYLARFRRKTFGYSKSQEMAKAILTIFFTPDWQRYLGKSPTQEKEPCKTPCFA